MAKRKLSILQKAYREFFLALLVAYEVDSPANLTIEQKREFFIRIREGWKTKKAELIRVEKKIPTVSKKCHGAAYAPWLFLKAVRDKGIEM